jgi:hypothetical protein
MRAGHWLAQPDKPDIVQCGGSGGLYQDFLTRWYGGI